MFKFTYKNNEYQVKFQHIQPSLWKKAQAEKPKVERRPIPKEAKGHKAVTICWIIKVEGTERVQVAKGVATTFDKDLFIKRMGRTISLGRAIKEAGFPANVVLNAYEDSIDKAILTSYVNLKNKKNS